MKRKAILSLCAAGLLALALTGCGGGTTGSQAEYIGIDAAKALALEAAGVAEADAQFSTAGLDRRSGMDYYAVEFTANGRSYEYDIDAVTGVIIEGNNGDGAAETPEAGDDTAQAAAASETPAAETTAAGTASSSPEVSSVSSAAPSASQTTITADQAKAIALSHAGLTADQVTFVHSELDRHDNRLVYELEFYTSDYTEYDYEIDATTGDIRSYDYEAEHHSNQSGTTSGTSITAEQAKAIALAEVPGATTSDIYKFETDRDDGRVVYEGKILYNSMVYEFTIDGYSGAIWEWEAEPYHH